MKTIKAQKLTREAFRPYGDYVQLIRDPKEFEGRKVDFTPDMLRLNLSRFTIASFSICRVLHMAPYAVNDTVNTIIVLPERTYANDCIVLRHGEDEILTIEK